jgi:hypothetical protein
MDIKSVFLNGPIKEEVYVEQPPGFESEEYPNHVYKLYKTLYGLKQAPRAWYECLRDFLIENDFKIGKADSTLFSRKMGKDLSVCQIYIDDIIFGYTNKSFCDERHSKHCQDIGASSSGPSAKPKKLAKRPRPSSY